ncbi:unnamed protein product [Camellia sinensis]
MTRIKSSRQAGRQAGTVVVVADDEFINDSMREEIGWVVFVVDWCGVVWWYREEKRREEKREKREKICHCKLGAFRVVWFVIDCHTRGTAGVSFPTTAFSKERPKLLLLLRRLSYGVLISAAGQLSKPFTSAILYGNSNNFDFKTVFRSGGFPSTHSSAAVATAMSLGFEWWILGLSDAVFGLAVVYASLIMCDAQRVRREVGIHAKALNRVLLQNSASSNDADDLIDSQPRKSSSNSKSFGPLFLEEADTFQAKQTNAKLLLRSENRKSQSGILISSSLASDVEGESKKIANSWAMLKESVGHNEIEVIAGALLGLFVSFA